MTKAPLMFFQENSAISHPDRPNPKIDNTIAFVNTAYTTGLQSEYFFCNINPNGITKASASKNKYPALKPAKLISLNILQCK